ncbi:AAA family ATPase [Acinetobacter baumannii]
MELISIVLENFRGYHLKHTILIDECLTGIIGKNDAGKSTIFEALDIFF